MTKRRRHAGTPGPSESHEVPATALQHMNTSDEGKKRQPPPPPGYRPEVSPPPPPQHPSAHKSVLESAKPRIYSEYVHLDAPGQRHGQQPPWSRQTGQVIRGLR